jgi:hypothetical protein
VGEEKKKAFLHMMRERERERKLKNIKWMSGVSLEREGLLLNLMLVVSHDGHRVAITIKGRGKWE